MTSTPRLACREMWHETPLDFEARESWLHARNAVLRRGPRTGRPAFVNAESGHLAGDRLIEQAARCARRAAARLGGTAYHPSGRRLGILIAARERALTPEVLVDVHAELLGGAAIRAAFAAWSPGDDGEAVLARARDAPQAERA